MIERNNLGKRARDRVSGFEGVIVGLCEYLTGCNQYGIQPPAKDGKLDSAQWFDVYRVEIIGEGMSADRFASPTDPGGPNRDAPR